jgi:hypothetical protein
MAPTKSYVPGYQWDIFLSYARLDDRPRNEGEKGWVSSFVHSLEIAIANYLGEEINLFFDIKDVKKGDWNLEHIKTCAANSAFMVSVVSPTYCRRVWTLEELDVFCAKPEQRARLFALERLPIGPEDSPPDILWQKIRAPFWHDLPNVKAKAPIRPVSERFDDLVMDFANTLKDHLRELRARKLAGAGPVPDSAEPEPEPDPAGPASSARPEPQPPSPEVAVRTVLIAQGTDDVAESIEGVRRYLGQFPEAVRVLSGTDYPQGGEEFAEAFGKDLQAADIVVQLLGARRGRSPPDLRTSYTCYQLDAARRAKKKVMQWRDRAIDVEALTDDAYRAILSDPLVAIGGLEEFKAEILKQARSAKAEGSRLDPSKVFINADRDNLDIAQSIGDEFIREKYELAFPKIDGSSSENRIYLDKMMAECGVLVLVHGCPQPAWVATQKRLFEHIRLRRDKDPAGLAVCTVPPGDRLGSDVIGNEFEQIDCSAGFEPEIVRGYIADLKQRVAQPAEAAL